MFIATDSQQDNKSNRGLIQQARKRLKERGGRMTVQRLLVLKALEELSDHPTAEELHEFVMQRDPTLHLSTVYRTLSWLEEEGLVKPRIFEDDQRKERFDPGHRPEHYHFKCLSCNQLIEFDNAMVNTIKAQFEQHSGAQVLSGSVTFYGICTKCR